MSFGENSCIDLSELSFENSICGEQKIIFDDPDKVKVSLVRIAVSKTHYHNNLTEYYYVLNGRGDLMLGDKSVKLKEQVLVEIQPQVIHKAIATRDDGLEILVIGIKHDGFDQKKETIIVE